MPGSYPPCAELGPWVAGFDILEASDADAQTILPDLGPVMGFQYRGRVWSLEDPGPLLLEECGITGIQSHARRFRYLPGSGTVLVRFHPWGASAFLPLPMDRIADRSVGLDSLLSGARTREMRQKLADARDDAGRIRAVEAFLLALLRNRTPDGLVRRAVRLLRSGADSPTVQALSAGLGLSERQLERKFKEWIGIGPKRFARLARFRGALHNLGVTREPAASAPDSAFFDQAHFIKEFRAFAGTTPEAYLRGLRGPREGLP